MTSAVPLLFRPTGAALDLRVIGRTRRVLLGFMPFGALLRGDIHTPCLLPCTVRQLSDGRGNVYVSSSPHI